VGGILADGGALLWNIQFDESSKLEKGGEA
jgi:hypothetical protein